MANNQQLPRPNIPTPTSPGDSNDQQGNQQTPASKPQGSQPAASGQQSSQPSTQPSQPSASNQQPASNKQPTSNKPPASKPPTASSAKTPPAPPASPVAGLDPQSPGGAPPQLNEQGQVTKAANISASRQAPTYEQPAPPPQSQAERLNTTLGDTKKPAQEALSQQPINPPSNQDEEESRNKIDRLEGQQSIRPSRVKQESPSAEIPTISTVKSKSNLTGTDDNDKSKKSSLGGKKGKRRGKKKKKRGVGAPQQKSSSSSQKRLVKSKPKLLNFLKKILFIILGLAVIGGVIFGISQVLDLEAIPGIGGGLAGIKNLVGLDDDSGVSDGETDSDVVVPSGESITYWGLWEPSSVLQEVLDDFEQQSGVRVNYVKQSPQDYRTRLQTQIASGQGPDVFRYHATWVPMLNEELAPMPNKVMTLTEYKEIFYPIMVQQLQNEGQIVGIPLMYDGLGLYYNKDILETANEEVPSTWGELRILAQRLTVSGDSGLERGGLAIGNTANVDHFSDILGLLIYQNGGDPSQPLSSEVRDAIMFFASFTQDSPVYSQTLPNSTVAFARGEVAMMFGPSWRAFEIMNASPELNFGIAPVPKLSEADYGWASYWAEGVNSKSQNQEEAWELLKYLSSKEVLRKLYSEQRKIRAFGEIFPRKDMVDEVDNDMVAAFLADAPTAKSWFLCSRTHDEGLNDQIIGYYRSALDEAINSGSVDEKLLQTLTQGVQQVLRQY